MIPWWMLILAAMAGGFIAVLLHGAILAGSRSAPRAGRWKGEHTGIEVDVDHPYWIPTEAMVWIREGPKPGDPHRSIERAWPVL